MKTLDTFSKRILVIAFSVSLILLSLSAFLLTIQRVSAEPKIAPRQINPTYVGLGVDPVKKLVYYGLITSDGGIAIFNRPLPQ